MKRISGRLAAVAGMLVLAAACASSGAGGRKIEITQTDAGCSPTSIAVTPGEKLNLVVKNKSSHDAYEMEGVDGTRLEELVVHAGNTRSVGYDVPSDGGVRKIKCYVPAGSETIIELVPNDAAAATPPVGATVTPLPSVEAMSTGAKTETSVAVTLVDYSVAVDKPSTSAGKIRFIATNASASQAHELAVLRTKPDGSFDKAGEVEAIAPAKGGSIELDLAPGEYQLACLITIGESGSTVDHYQQGMHTPLTVQ